MKLFAVLLASLASSPAFVIKGDRSFAGIGFRDTQAKASRILGRPDRVQRQGTSCYVTWRRVGVRVELFAFAPDDPCAKGTVLTATITAARWRTSTGLRIGDPVARIKRTNPHATPHPGGWWLVTRRACELGGNKPYGSLIARVRGGRVVALVLQGAVCE